MSAPRVRLSLKQSSTALQPYGWSIHDAWLQMTRRAPRKGLKASATIDEVKNCLPMRCSGTKESPRRSITHMAQPKARRLRFCGQLPFPASSAFQTESARCHTSQE